jgi:hypothetical protein
MKLLIVLDLDQTIVDSIETTTIVTNQKPDFSNDQWQVFVRNGFHEFVSMCEKKDIEFGVWTAGSQSYANFIVSHLFQNHKPPLFVFDGRRCCGNKYTSNFAGMYDNADQTPRKIKPLKKIWKQQKFRSMGISKHNILVLDDTPQTYDLNYGNAILMPRFWIEYGNNDDCFSRLFSFIESKLLDQGSVRYIEKRNWYFCDQ